MSRNTVVVVGNGMVGQRFVEELRERDVDGQWRVIVIGEEQHAAYDRVALTSYVSGSTLADLTLVADGFYDGTDYALRLSERVELIDVERRSLTTDRGLVLHYDALVLATGSRPFVPPVAGADLPGVHVYRTIDDLDAIRADLADAKVGAVIGGGLLGLEAAGAARALGLRTHVVEAAPRLMPIQVDEGGGHALARAIRGLGVMVHVGAFTKSLEPNDAGRVSLLKLSDGAEIDADVVIMAAGIRPRDELARAAGLAVGERGGVLVDASCRTAEASIWAIGECAAVEGRTYGLVAPGYNMAAVVASNLLGEPAAFVAEDMSTKLKLLGVEVGSVGDAHAETEGALELVWSDQVSGRYTKLVVTDDAKTLLGAVLVGDTSAYGTLRALIGREIGCSPEQLVLPATDAAARPSLPMDAQVCSCQNVTKGTIVESITSGACADVACIKACTKAGTVCGSCVPMLKQLLNETGVVQSTALCEHFEQSRPELFEIMRVRAYRSFSEVLAALGTGRGCAICKPVVASILASLGTGHVLDGERASLQDSNDHHLANLQKDGSYSVVPRIPGGEITAEGLIVIGEIARDFGLYTKITGGQRIDLFGARVEQLPDIWRRLVDAGFESGHAYGKALRTVKSCVGSDWCRFGVQDSVGLAVELELRYRGLRAPHKIKGGVSGCARECAEARGKDFGVIATEQGWNLYLGGNGGFTPRHAQLFASDLDTATLLTYIDRFLMFYVRTADRLQRTAPWMETMEGGMAHLRDVIVNDSLGICDDLDAAMAQHIAGYEDEWRAVLEDPERLARFTSFVNAPGTPDPDIAIVERQRAAGPVQITSGRIPVSRSLEVLV